MTETGTNQPICPDCGEELGVDEEWIITDPSLIGTQAGDLEDEQGVYAHARCRPIAAALAEVGPL